VKKSLYSWLIEKPRFSRAAAIAVVTPREADTIKAFVPNYKKPVRWVPNPMNVYDLAERTWEGNIQAKRLVYLGRFDVTHKGIDILANIARCLPLDIEIHLYGMKEQKTAHLMEPIERNMPSNMHLHKPVFGAEKAQVLAQASLYLQTSRWEVFGISVAEAMYSGVPCAIAQTMNLSDLFQEYDLGLVLPATPQAAADRITHALAQPEQLHRWSEQARAYVQEHFHPKTIALKYLELYSEATQS
jgi:glycosyltransferase involved in cell wall biosynthesis